MGDYYELLNKRLQYLQKLLQDFKSKRLVMIKIEPFSNITEKIWSTSLHHSLANCTLLQEKL